MGLERVDVVDSEAGGTRLTEEPRLTHRLKGRHS